jgi:hypothetical protein
MLVVLIPREIGFLFLQCLPDLSSFHGCKVGISVNLWTGSTKMAIKFGTTC